MRHYNPASAYVVSSRAFDEFLGALQEDGLIVDNGALQSIPGQLVLLPFVGFNNLKGNDFRVFDDQRATAVSFGRQCMPGQGPAPT